MLVPLKDLVDIITALVAIAVFIFGLLKFIDATAIYTFGYYARLAAQSAPFWEGLDKGEPFYSRFLKFCEDATTYKPSSKAGDFTF